MWCAHCKADVATDVSPDNRRVRCTTCSADLATAVTGNPTGIARDARELLARWSHSDLLDPFGPIAGLRPRAEIEPVAAPAIPAPESPEPLENTPKQTTPEVTSAAEPKSTSAPRRIRLDDAPAPRQNEGVDAPATQQDAPCEAVAEDREKPLREPAEAPTRRHVPLPLRSARRVHRPHRTENRAPHFPVAASPPPRSESQPTRTNAESILGHLIAYLGVMGLTIGGILIVWSYFGGPEGYAPTGWFITTIGQMLLFLGVVTLVSKGLEQTTIEVTRRVDHLGEQLLRVEQVVQDRTLQGPHIPPERFARSDDVTDTKSSTPKPQGRSAIR